jgi:hypothetical protein
LASLFGGAEDLRHGDAGLISLLMEREQAL